MHVSRHETLYANIFNPIIEMMRVVMENNLQKVAGSRNMNIPTITAPTAPIPVQTGYAVPNGIV